MCGICAIIGRFDGNGKLFKELLTENMPRGFQATGMIWRITGKEEVSTFKLPGPVTEFLNNIKIHRFSNTDYMVGHTRNSTSGNPKINEENHPHIYGDWIVVHNGVIYNTDDLYAKCEVEKTLNCDSAVIPVVFEKFGFKEGLEMLDGWFSIIAVNKKEPEKLYVAKNSTTCASLFIGRLPKGKVLISSIRNTISKTCKKYYSVKENTYKVFNTKTGEMIANENFKEYDDFERFEEDMRTIGMDEDIPDGINEITLKDLVNQLPVKSSNVKQLNFKKAFKGKTTEPAKNNPWWPHGWKPIGRKIINSMIEYGD